MVIDPNQSNVNGAIQRLPPSEPVVDTPAPVVRAWRGGATFGLGAIVLFAHFVTQLAVATVFLVVNIASGTLDYFRIADSLENGLATSVTVIVSAIVGVILTIVFIRMRKGISVRDYLALKPISKKTVFGVLALTAGLFALEWFIEYIAGISDSDADYKMFRTDVPGLLFIALAVFAPFFEETFFRGFLFAGFRQSKMGAVGAILLTAFLFAVLHIQYNYIGISIIFGFGVVLGIVRLKTGSLWSPMIMHAFWNFIVTLMMTLSSNGVIK